MTSRDGVPTQSGTLSIQSGELHVRTTPKGIIRAQYLDNWKGKDRLQKGWFLFSNLFATITFGQILNDPLEFSGELVSMGFLLSAVLVHFVAGGLRFVNKRFRSGISIPLRTIRKVEHKSDPKKLEVVHGEFENVDTTEIEFPTGSSAEQAIELLRWKGIRIGKLRTEKANLRAEIDRELETETN
ncbi:hypothetical protein [Haladaptatus caseinilyticus]|uniref:hypothetical protein n=1 Tax=Haladaptatus caseinilyticus TaxID=2993314 RepID=UPI00224A4D65|nr:hypothetical protein [Haladaptatus caseinilyticus]